MLDSKNPKMLLLINKHSEDLRNIIFTKITNKTVWQKKSII